MKISDISIGNRLRAGFGLMAGITLLLGTVSILQIQEVSRSTSELYDHPFTVTNAIRDIRGNVLHVEILLADLDPGVDQVKVAQVDQDMRAAMASSRGHLAVVYERYRGNRADIAAFEESFDRWSALLDQAIAAHQRNMDLDSQRAAVAAARRQTTMVMAKAQMIIDFAKKRAGEFHDSAAYRTQQAIMVMAGFILAACAAGLLVSLGITMSITTPLRAMIVRLRAISQGELGDELDYASKDEIGELAEALRTKRRDLEKKILVAEAVASGDYGQVVELSGPRDALGKSLAAMTVALRASAVAAAESDWIKTGRNKLSALLAGEQDIRTLSATVINFLCTYLNVQIGVLYAKSPEDKLVLTGSYAFTKRKGLSDSYALGQGLVGQAALERDLISLTDIPQDYIRVNSALGEAQPRNIVVFPILHEDQLKGVAELGSLAELSDAKLEFLREAAQAIGVAFHTAENQTALRALLEQTRTQADRLQAQQEELRVSNEELEQQAAALRSSEEELRQQQEELQAINEELEEKTDFLELQRAEMGKKNVELDAIRKGLERQARELELTTRYKSEFLANMSHELRTPLNSLLLLSRNLMENGRGNLEPEQVEYARIIFRSGNDLLNLINEILDLSKIEAGKMDIHPETFPMAELAESLTANFKPLTDEKGLSLTVHIDENLPPAIHTDRQRMEQILRNLLSNAVKFCERGGVTVVFQRPEPDIGLEGTNLDRETALAVAVTDSGLGIPAEKQQEIFEAFHQAEGGTARRYGGTGLGLTISRELARLLGGVVRLKNEPGVGSTFTLVLPLRYAAGEDAGSEGAEDLLGASPLLISAQQAGASSTGASESQRLFTSAGAPSGRSGATSGPATRHPAPSLDDDRDQVPAGGGFILIVEDDPGFARVLLDQCRAKGFHALHAGSGEDDLELARRYPVGAMVLDIRLPGMSGWQVLDILKHDPELRHIPVHVMSAVEGCQEALRKGAMGFLTKPAAREDLDRALEQLEAVMRKQVKDLLLVEDDPAMRAGLSSLLSDANIKIHEAKDGAQAISALKERRFDCMILDLGLPDMTGFELLSRLKKETDLHMPPVIVYTGRELSREEERELRDHAESIIIKGVKSEERLIDETALFLHQMVKAMPAKKRELIATLYDKDQALRGKTVLLVDDDMRNLYALAHVLQEKGLNVLKAENGVKALELLNERPGVDLVLLDIMMPVMDGYETLAHIRATPGLAGLPVIALTAKAMREDKAKCIAAGASDYLSKPVDLDRLLSVLRVWLYTR